MTPVCTGRWLARRYWRPCRSRGHGIAEGRGPRSLSSGCRHLRIRVKLDGI